MTAAYDDDLANDEELSKPGMVGGMPRHWLFDRLSEHRHEVDGGRWLFRRYRLSQINRACANIDNIVAENLPLLADWQNKDERQREAITRCLANIADTRLLRVDVFDNDGLNVGVWEIVIPIIFQLVKWAIEWYLENRT